MQKRSIMTMSLSNRTTSLPGNQPIYVHIRGDLTPTMYMHAADVPRSCHMDLQKRCVYSSGGRSSFSAATVPALNPFLLLQQHGESLLRETESIGQYFEDFVFNLKKIDQSGLAPLHVTLGSYRSANTTHTSFWLVLSI